MAMDSLLEPPRGLTSEGRAAAERRRKLEEFLAAKGKKRRGSAAAPKPYLKDRTNQQNRAACEPDPVAKHKKNDFPTTAKGIQKGEPKQAFLPGSLYLSSSCGMLASQRSNTLPSHLSRRRPATLIPPKRPAKNSSKNLSLSAKHFIGQTRKNEDCGRAGITPGARSSRTSWQCPLNSTLEKKEHIKKSRVVKNAPHLQKRVAILSLKGASQVSLNQPVKKTKEAADLPGKSQACATAEVHQVQGNPRDPPSAQFRHAAHSQRQVPSSTAERPSSKLGQSSVFRPTVRNEGQNSGVLEQSVENIQTAGALGQKGEDAALLTHPTSHVGTNACLALQENKHPNHSQVLRKSKPRRCSSVVHDGSDHSRSLAERNQNSMKLNQVPRIFETKSRHKVSACCTASSLKGGGGKPRSKQPEMRSSQEPRTPCAQDRRQLLQEWLASKRKQYKRPPMSLPPRRPPEREEEEKAKREQRVLAHKIAGTLAECLKLAEEGFPSEELLAMLSHIPEGEKFALFWICKARLLARQGTLDATALYKEAVGAGAAPLLDLRDVIVEILKNSSKTGRDMPAAACSLQKEHRPQSILPKVAYKPVSAIKLQVTRLHRSKEQSREGAVMKLLTPVRRSLRIESAAACYPQMLKDHNPVVSSLEEIMDNESQFVFRKNEALTEKMGMAEFEAVLPPLLQNACPAAPCMLPH